MIDNMQVILLKPVCSRLPVFYSFNLKSMQPLQHIFWELAVGIPFIFSRMLTFNEDCIKVLTLVVHLI